MENSDHTSDYFSFQREKKNGGRKFIFHLLDLAIVSAHILHIQKIKQTNPLECFIKIVTEG